MVLKGTSTNKTIVILDNVKDSNILSDLKFFGAVETKKTKNKTFFKFNRGKKFIKNKMYWNIQEVAEAYNSDFIDKKWVKTARCNWCGCYLGDLEEKDIVNNTCRECFEMIEKTVSLL